MKRRLEHSALALAALSACAGSGSAAVRLGPLPAAWRPARLHSAGQLFHHAQGGALCASALCRGVDDVSLDVLTNHLLFGIEERRELSRSVATLAGRAALRTRVQGSLDGVTVTMELLVSKKDGCVYDLVLVAAPQVFAARLRDFDAALAGFGAVGRP